MDVLLIEDDPVHRAFLKEVIEAAMPECSRLLEADDGQIGERLAHEHQVACVVMDLQMPRRTGVEAAKTIWKERPETSILFWSNYADEAYVRGIARIVPQGAAYGYILKTASEERLRLALRSLFIEQQCVIDREIRGVQQKAQDQSVGLTDAEYEVLQDIALGLTDRTIAKPPQPVVAQRAEPLAAAVRKAWHLSTVPNRRTQFGLQPPGPRGKHCPIAQTAQSHRTGAGRSRATGMAKGSVA